MLENLFETPVSTFVHLCVSKVSGAMIRPEMPIHSSETLDVDFSIPVRLQARQLHCGLGMNGFYWEPSWIQKFATHRVFVAVLASLGFLQGAAMGYFIATVNVVANSFGFSHGLVCKCGL